MRGFSIDTRRDCRQKLFVALPGGQGDGHDYLEDAVKEGARGVMISSDRDFSISAGHGEVAVFKVSDPLYGLQTMAQEYCKEIDPAIVAITGSTGKTTTKNLIASILGSNYRSYSTPGNMNNHIGLPLTVLGMEGGEELLVVEMGANHKGEIKRLCEICRPTTGVVTNVGRSHLEFFESLEGVAAAKAELLEALPPEGQAVLPADDRFIDFLRGRTEASVITFGFHEQADWSIGEVIPLDSGGYEFTVGGNVMRTVMPGRHNLLNVAAAVATAASLDIDMKEIISAVADIRPDPGRGGLFDIGGIIFMNDSYNSNPDSLRVSVDTFMELEVEGNRWLVLGDMLELGEQSEGLHREAGEYCGKAGVDGLVTLGDKTVELSRAAAEQRKAPSNISHFMEVEKLSHYLNRFLQPGDAVLVKGSRGMRMERVMEIIEKLRETERRRIN